MTAELVNLRRARKAKARTDRETTAATNRAAFGRTKAEKVAEKTEHDRAARALDGHSRRDDGRDRE